MKITQLGAKKSKGVKFNVWTNLDFNETHRELIIMGPSPEKWEQTRALNKLLISSGNSFFRRPSS